MLTDRRRGSYLMLALFFTVIATTAALGLIELLPSESAALRIARLDESSSRAAEAGVRDSIAWISRQLAIGNEPLSSPTLTRTGSFGDWQWSVEIEADSHTPPHTRSGMRMYRLVSLASYQGKPHRRIRCWAQAGESLAKYALLNDQPDPSLWDLLLLPNERAVEGALHTNGHFQLVIYRGTMAGATPPLNGKLTSSGIYASPDGFRYAQGGEYEQPGSPDDYEKLNVLGRSGFQAGVDPLPIPTSSAPLAEAAWGSPPPAAPPAGVTVHPTGGVFIQGDVDELTLAVVSGNCVISIRQGGSTVRVTRVSDTPVDGAGLGSRLVDRDGAKTVVEGLGSGVCFSTGDIRALRGEVKGRNTVATDFSAGKNIEIVGNITRNDTPLGETPTSPRDKLGVVASRILISDDPSRIPSGGSTHLFLYAAMFADDQWLVESASSRSPFRGSIYGGLQSRLRSPYFCHFLGTAVVSGMTGPTGNGTPLIVGDMHMANEPPPFFPSSERGKMVIRYWKEEPVV